MRIYQIKKFNFLLDYFRIHQFDISFPSGKLPIRQFLGEDGGKAKVVSESRLMGLTELSGRRVGQATRRAPCAEH